MFVLTMEKDVFTLRRRVRELECLCRRAFGVDFQGGVWARGRPSFNRGRPAGQAALSSLGSVGEAPWGSRDARPSPAVRRRRSLVHRRAPTPGRDTGGSGAAFGVPQLRLRGGVVGRAGAPARLRVCSLWRALGPRPGRCPRPDAPAGRRQTRGPGGRARPS